MLDIDKVEKNTNNDEASFFFKGSHLMQSVMVTEAKL